MQELVSVRGTFPGMKSVKGLYEKRGWFSYRQGVVDGVRVPAVALKPQILWRRWWRWMLTATGQQRN